MTLQVIGSGFCRTGTTSLKAALERLGFGPCHHMYEVYADPPQVSHWQALAAGRTPEWTEVFAGFRSQVDFPGAAVWRELADAFPDAKVIHSVRPEETWWRSFERTVGRLMLQYEAVDLPPHVRTMLAAWEVFAGEPLFARRYGDRETVLAAYRARTEAVVAALPPERLLVFDVAEGWEPLCRFLGAGVPDEPFPHRNLRADFWQVVGGEPS